MNFFYSSPQVLTQQHIWSSLRSWKRLNITSLLFNTGRCHFAFFADFAHQKSNVKAARRWGEKSWHFGTYHPNCGIFTVNTCDSKPPCSTFSPVEATLLFFMKYQHNLYFNYRRVENSMKLTSSIFFYFFYFTYDDTYVLLTTLN